MIDTLKRFFEDNLGAPEQEDEQHRVCRLQLASAALLMELMKTDRHIDERETREFSEVLRKTFSLDRESLAEITELAEEEAEQATSLYEFTSLVNENYSQADRIALIENMWRVAYADGNLDKYEEQLIRKTADLIYVHHSDFIRCKLRARDSADSGPSDQGPSD